MSEIVYQVLCDGDRCGIFKSLKSAKDRARKLFSNNKVAFRNRQYGYTEVYADSKLTNAIICKETLFD